MENLAKFTYREMTDCRATIREMFTGLAGAGDLLATILFSRVRIPTEVAELFNVIGLNARIAMLPLLRKPLFA